MNRFLQKFVGEPSDASWASARVEEETGASSFFSHKHPPSPPQPQNDTPLTSTSTGGVYDTVDLFEDSSAKSLGHQQQSQHGYMLHGHGQRLQEEVLAEPQYDPPTSSSLFPSPRNGLSDPFAKATASSLFSYGQRQPSPRRTAADMFGPSSEPAMTFPPPPQQPQVASDPFGPSSAPGSSFPSRPPQQEQQSHLQQPFDPFARHSQTQSDRLSFPAQQTSFQAVVPFAASSGLSFPSQPPQHDDPLYATSSQEPAPTSHSSSDVPASDFFSLAPASASSLFSSEPPAAPCAADLFAAVPANQQDWATHSATEATSIAPGPEAPRQEPIPVPVEVEMAAPALHEQAPQQHGASPVQPPQEPSYVGHAQPPHCQDRAYSGSSLPPRSQSSQPPRSHKSALDDQIRLVEMYKHMAERLEVEKNDLLKVLADQSDQFYRMQDYISSLERELAAYRPPQ